MNNPVVGIVMGSDSDWDVMQHAAKQLEHFGCALTKRGWFRRIAPRTRCSPTPRLRPSRGLRCIIAGAGGAAHLPGMLAAKTTLPVLGVPVPSRYLQGPRLAAVHRADAQGRAGGDLRHRRGRRCQCRHCSRLPCLRSPTRRSPHDSRPSAKPASRGAGDAPAAGEAVTRPCHDRTRRLAGAARRRPARQDVHHGGAEHGLPGRGARSRRATARRAASPTRISPPTTSIGPASRRWRRAARPSPPSSRTCRPKACATWRGTAW